MSRSIRKLITISVLSLTLSASEDDDKSNVQVCDIQLEGQDCLAYPFEVCDQATSLCVHKSIFPIETSEIVAYILLPILFAVASVGGVGGGIILVPLLIGFLHFTTKESIALTSAIVTESALIRFIFFSAHSKHPDRPGATEIDYNIVRVAYPLFQIGTFFGVMLSVSLGELILAILIMTVLSVLSIQVLWKAISLFKKESIKLAAEDGDYITADDSLQDGNKEQQKISSSSPRSFNNSPANGVKNDESTETDLKPADATTPLQYADEYREKLELEEVLERERSTCSQWRIQLQCTVLTLLSILVNLLRGTPKFDSLIGLSMCGWTSWFILIIFITICIACTYHNVTSILKEQELKIKYGKLTDSEKWMSRSNLPLVLSLALIASFIGQCFGLGGGFIFGPMLLSIGVNPMVSSSTCLYMIVFSSTSSMLMFLLFGKLNIAYFLWVAIFTGIGVIFGLFAIKALMKRYKRPSLVAFALATAIIISTLISFYSSIKSLKMQISNDIDVFKGDPVC